MRKSGKKLLTAVMSVVMAGTMAFSAAGCGDNTPAGSDGENVVDVKIMLAGYGTEWFKQAAKKFEQLYADKGYKINLAEESTTVSESVASEIQTPKTNGTDLYFVGSGSGGIDVSSLTKRSAAILRTNDRTLLENLNDVYSSPAISFDGKEESVTIAEKMPDSEKPYFKFNGTGDAKLKKWEGNYYMFPWASGPAGMYVNTAVLKAAGWDYIPRTTDEMLKLYKDMCPAAADGVPTPVKTGVYPMTYAGKNAAGYWTYLWETFYAQYSGYKADRALWSLNDTAKEDGYEVYNYEKDAGLLESYKVMEKLTDEDYCAAGTANLAMTAAQLNVLNGKAAYMVTGSWVNNEMKVNYADIADNMIFMRTPVISALGAKLGITDEQLASAVSGVDDGKTDAEIATETGVTEEVAARIREARGIYYSVSVNHVAAIPSYSPSKNVAKLFLRFLASDDNMDLYGSITSSTLPFNYAGESKITKNAFLKSAEDATKQSYSVMIADDFQASPVRQIGMTIHCGYGTYSEVFLGLSQKTLTAQKIVEKNYTFAKSNWDTYIRQAGI